MKGKIDKNGFLNIERAEKLKKQLCPHQSDGTEVASRSQNDGSPDVIYNMQTHCGDWCPLFGEPMEDVNYQYNEERQCSEEIKTGNICISLCHSLLTFDTFTDERNNAEV